MRGMGLFSRRSRDNHAGAGRTPGPPGPGAPHGQRGDMSPAEIVAGYHERTKHQGHRFAASAGFLDWDNQPDPFRRHDGAPLHALPRPLADTTPPYDDLYVPGRVPSRPLGLETLSALFYYALALSAWKRHGEAHWSLRVNPSSGNLHPTEGWAALPAIAELGGAPGLFHYQPKEHALAARARWRPADWDALVAGCGAQGPCFFLALSSIPWRESWKYGERAWRYCQHDVGHALAALACSAALLGWRVRVLPAVEDAALGALLGLDREDGSHAGEPEHPDLLALVECAPRPPPPPPARGVPAELLAALARHATWAGRANLTSPEHREWEVIEIVEAATRKDAAWCAATELGAPSAPADTTASAKPGSPSASLPVVTAGSPAAMAASAAPPAQASSAAHETPDWPAAPVVPQAPRPAGAVIRARRSAVALDGHTGLTAAGLCELLARLLPASLPQPWDALGAPPLVDLALFVHRVRDIEPGIYALVRDASRQGALRASFAPDFLWTAPPAAPAGLPLYLLRAGNAQNLASSVSCGQDIAGRGAFSLGMLASFAPALARHGAPVYRHLYWECGFLGQILYLEAEALGIAGTGIGCFFDDAVHQVLGLADRSVQSLYHFTLGGPVHDERLTTEPAYEGPGVP